MTAVPRPQVRTLLLCEDIVRTTDRPLRLSLLRLVSVFRGTRYPTRMNQLCVFAQLTECRGVVNVRVDVCHVGTGTVVYSTPPLPSSPTGNDPLAVRAVNVRLRDVTLNDPGLYTVRLWCETDLLDERPLLLQ